MRPSSINKSAHWSSALALLCVAVTTLVLLAAPTTAFADPPTTTARELGWQHFIFTIYLDCAAGTTQGDELYATDYKMDFESSFHETLWSSGAIGGTAWVMCNLFNLTHYYDGIHQFTYYSVGHNDVSGAYEEETPKSMPVRIDTASPTLTVSGKPTAWVSGERVLTFTATDPNMPNASGINELDVAVDGDVATWTYPDTTPAVSQTRVVPAPSDHANDGVHEVEYWATDWADNESIHDAYANSFSFGIDTQEPATKAFYAAAARRGRTAALRYQVVDPEPNGGKASVTIKIKNRAGRVVRTLKPVVKPVNAALSWKFTVPRTWKAATYRFYVSATDTAGNKAAVASNKLIVK